MYGFVNSALEKLITRRFGEEIWQEIHAKAAVVIGEEHSFMTNHIYNDKDTVEVIKAAVEILGIDSGSLLEMFGEQFLLWCRESGYAKTLQLLGRNLIDFLGNLDALHDHLSVIYPEMRAPSFRCTEGDDGVITLHYYSERHGLECIVPGIVKSVSRELHDLEVMVECMDKEESPNGQTHAIFSITPIKGDDIVNLSKKRRLVRLLSISTQLPLLGVPPPMVSAHLFCKAFPFHIIFDRSMRIRQLGDRLKKLINQHPDEELLITSVFGLQRPRVEFTFQNILNHINTVYILGATIDHPSLGKRDYDDSAFMRLRGQMLFMEDCDCMLYVCSPYVRSLDDLSDRGLFISDIPIHDASRGLIITEGALKSEFQYAVEMERILDEKEMLTHMLQERKERMRNLLLEIMPSSVANKLLHGSTVEARNFECVTILFSDIVGFTRICQKCKPDQVVNMLNDLYCYFDQVVSRNNVYKVETIGDAYMVVGGLPEISKTHAADVCNQAIDMMMCAQKVKDPTNTNKSITIRIGIHSGEVAAGVVGIRMPRYCLFGDTVNVASRTESNSVPGRINVTEWTYVHLRDKPNWMFEVRGPVHFKNVDKPVVCYWLIENTDRSRQPKPSLQRPSEVPVFAEFIPSSATTPRHPSRTWESQPSPDIDKKIFASDLASRLTRESFSDVMPFSESVANRLAYMGHPRYSSLAPSEVPSRSSTRDSEVEDGLFMRSSLSSSYSSFSEIAAHKHRLGSVMSEKTHRLSLDYSTRRSQSPKLNRHNTIAEGDEIPMRHHSYSISGSDLAYGRMSIPTIHKSSDTSDIADKSSISTSCSDFGTVVHKSSSSTTYSDGGIQMKIPSTNADGDRKPSTLSPEPGRKISNVSEHSFVDSGCEPMDPTEIEQEASSETQRSTRKTGVVNCTSANRRNSVRQRIQDFEKLSGYNQPDPRRSFSQGNVSEKSTLQ